LASKVYITLDVDDKGSATMRKFGGNTDRAFDKLKKGARAGAAQAGKMERAWKTSINHLKRHWKAYGVASVAAIYGVTKILSGAINKMKEYVGLSNIQEAAEKDMEAVLKATGNACGYNLDQLKKMASGMQIATKVGDEVTLSGMAILGTFKKIRGEGFERATMAALDMSQVMKQDLKGSMTMIGKAVNDPITGMSALTRVGVTFTDQQKDMVKQLQKSGDMVGAQNIILKELEGQFGGAAAAAREIFGGAVEAAGNALGDTKEEMGFLITKNQFFIDIVHLAEKQFIAWGEKIKENRGYLQDLLKSGVLKLVDGIIFTTETMRFFHNAWLGIKLVGTAALHAVAIGIEELAGGIRFLLTPIDLLFEGLKKLGIVDVNPFDKIEESLGQFRASSLDVTKEVVSDIAETNKTYDLVIDKVESWQKAIKAIPVEQIETEKKVIEPIENISNAQTGTTGPDYTPTEKTKERYVEYYAALEEMAENADINEIMRERERLEELESFTAPKLALVEAEMQAKRELQEQFDEEYAERNMSQFDLEREQVDKLQEMYEEAGVNEVQLAQLIAKKKAAISKAENAQKLSDIKSSISMMTQGFKQISEMGGQHSKETFAMYKAFKITETVIATYSGAVKAFESMAGIPYIGPILGAAAAAAAIAFGMAQVAMISSSQPPSYDQGGISNAAGLYRTGPIREAHIPLPSGEKLPVRIEDSHESPPVSPQINIYISGNVVDHDAFAREIIPSISKAVADGVR